MTPAAYATNPVGATPGSFTVSSSGAATYSIPLATPPGTNGMQPNVSLNYSSQGGNGLLGIGWSVGGLSVIHRCGATIAIDGFKGGVNYDNNDKFCLDGERLIAIGNNEYRTSHESWQRVIASDGTTNPASFTVYERDGTIRSYGASTDSRILASPPNTSIVRLWALNEIQDHNSNYLTITYQNNDATTGEYYPLSMAYTGNSNGSVAPYNFVYFDYQTRTDVTPFYQAGSLVETAHRLSDIRTCIGTSASCTATGGALVRQYNLTYDNNGTVGRSRLLSVQECGSDTSADCLPATVLTWTPAPASPVGAAQNTGIGANPRYGLVLADINGGGWDDLTWLDYSSYHIYTAMASPGTVGGFAPATDSGVFSWAFSTGDINGDGLSDLLGVPIGWISYSLTTSAGLQQLIGTGWFPGPGNPALLADIDGDGRADLTWLNGSAFDYAFSIGNGFGGLHSSSAGSVTGIAPADFNGDGRADMLCIQQSGGVSNFNYALSTGTGFSSCNTTGLSGTPTAGPWAVDFNGDGKTDLVWIQNGYIYYAFSTGTGFTTATNSYVAPALGAANSITLADINGDGLPDVVWIGNDGYIRYSLATGNGYHTNYSTNVTASISSGPWAVDFNGDGKQDLVWLFNGTLYTSLSQGAPTDLLQTVTDGLSVQTTVSYKALTDKSGSEPVYTKENTAVYPYQDVENATYVVSSYTQTNGILNNGVYGTNTSTMYYGGLKRHLTANVSLGFHWIEMIDPAGNVHETDYNQTLDGTEGTVSASAYYAPGGDGAIKQISNTWTPVSLGTGRTVAELTNTWERTSELIGSVISQVTTSNVYDSYERPTSVTVTYAANGVPDGWQKTTANTYNNPPDTTNWFLDQLIQSQVTAQAPGQPTLIRTSSFSYDTLGRLQTEVIEPNNASLTLTTTYTYDSFGNRATKQVQGTNIATRYEYQRQYDVRGQFLAWQKNALNQQATYNNYDYRNGKVTKLTDSNNLITQWFYNDGFARLTQESRPDTTYTTYSYLACDGTCPANATSMATTAMSGAGTTWVYLDQFGREVRRKTQGFGGALVYRDTTYDALGRISSVSEPYYSGATVYYTSYGYDAINRVQTVTAPVNRTTTTSYNGLTTTVTSPPTAGSPSGETVTTVKDSQGHIVQATDAAGTTSYQYDAFGDQVQVTDVAGNVATMAYDLRGRKIAMHDPDMGNWSYTYDVLNELLGYTDAKIQNFTNAYDKLGRRISSTTPYSSTTWTYDTAAHGVGKLATVTGVSNNANHTYVYDTLSRLTSDTTSISGVNYPVTTTYDSVSRVNTLTYPSGFALQYVYDPYQYGFVSQIKNASTGASYWQINANGVDAHDRVINENFGNGLTSVHDYYPDTGYLQDIRTGTSAVPHGVQNLAYVFDAIGNLTFRADYNQGNLNEQFGYDGLNRLTSVTGPSPKTYAYYPNGNIQSKSDVGTYTYPANGTNSIRPHAVSSIAGTLNTSFTYDANGNQLTGNGKTIAYYTFNKPKTITANGQTTTLTFDGNFDRVIKSNPSGTTVYIGKLYEYVTSGSTTTQRHYLYAGNRLVGLSTQTGSTTTVRYFHTDHLGSIDTVTDASGNVVQHLSYDAHGKRRNPNWTDATGTITSPTTRGFTEQEHDDEVSLVNMNAREYDPYLGRFNTPDTIVQSPYSSQGLNRYSYTDNNPLSYIDPTGHGFLSDVWHDVTGGIDRVFTEFARVWMKYGATVAAVAISDGIYNGMVAAGDGSIESAATAGATVGGITGGNVKSAAYGAIAAVAFAEVGDMPGENNPVCMKCIAAHALVGGAVSDITYGDFRSGFISAGFSELAAPVLSHNELFPDTASKVLAAGVIGGEAASLAGGSFNNGFVTSAFGYLFSQPNTTKSVLRQLSIGDLQVGDVLLTGDGGSATYLKGFGDYGHATLLTDVQEGYVTVLTADERGTIITTNADQYVGGRNFDVFRISGLDTGVLQSYLTTLQYNGGWSQYLSNGGANVCSSTVYHAVSAMGGPTISPSISNLVTPNQLANAYGSPIGRILMPTPP